MDVRPHVQKWGNSLGIRIPKAFAQKLGLAEGTSVEMEVDDDRIIIRRKRYSLEELLSKIARENLHDETDTGISVGLEEW